MSDIECRAWTLLLTGDETGIVGGAGRHFEKHPRHYERVTVLERDPVVRRIAELEAEKMEIAQHDCAQVLANDRLLLTIEGLKAENQRLREALEEISTGERYYPEQYARKVLLGGGE